MNKMFSVVSVSSEYGLLVEYFAAGCPDCAEDLLDDEVIRDDLASQPRDSTVHVEVETYLYGEGETGSVWLILAYYKSGLQGGGEENLTTEDTDKDQENQEDQEEQEDLGNTDPTA